MCNDSEYRTHVMAHVQDLRFLDYTLVDKGAISKAKEAQYDVLSTAVEEEKEEEKKANIRREAEAKRLDRLRCNLTGVEELYVDMMAQDEEYPKFR